MAASAPDHDHDHDRLVPLVARPLSAPEGVEGSRRRRWELFAPTLAACLQEALTTSTRSLFEEANQARKGSDRHRLASTAASELAARTNTIEARCTSALLSLFLDADGLAAHWQTSTGAFALSLGAERLLSSQAAALGALGRRLHGASRSGLPADARVMAAQLAGLLAAALDTENLPAHARNVLVMAWNRRMENVLPGLAGLAGRARQVSAPVLARRSIEPAGKAQDMRVPTAVLDALTHAQLQGLDDEDPADWACRLRQRLASTSAGARTEAIEQSLSEIDAEAHALVALCGAMDTSPLAARHLRRLGPVLARIHIQHHPVHPAANAWLQTLLEATLDLTDGSRDPRLHVLEELVCDALTRFSGPGADLVGFLEGAYSRLEPCLRNQRERRNRSRDAALEDRRLLQAEERAESICKDLLERTALEPFVASVWRKTLMHSQLQHGEDSGPWRRLLTLGEALLTRPLRDLRRDRAAYADALSLVLSDASAVEAELDALYEALERTSEAPVAAAPTLDEGSAEVRRAPLDDGPWRLEDGRRCWVLHEDTDVLLSDALGQALHWRTRASFDAALARDEIKQLSAGPALKLYARR